MVDWVSKLWALRIFRFGVSVRVDVCSELDSDIGNMSACVMYFDSVLYCICCWCSFSFINHELIQASISGLRLAYTFIIYTSMPRFSCICEHRALTLPQR